MLNLFVRRIFLFAVVSCVVILTGCTTSPPKKPDSICSIFKEKGGWYKAARKSEKRWNSPISSMMAIMYQESRFVAKAKPPRKKYLGFIPGPRKSSAYGYSQAKKGTWKQYKKATGRGGADRDNFKDAIDFIGWYNSVSYKRNGIRRDDTYHLYLAYHEGHGGFSRRTFKNKQWLKSVAKKVSARSIKYRQQLVGCEKDLQRDWWPFW